MRAAASTPLPCRSRAGASPLLRAVRAPLLAAALALLSAVPARAGGLDPAVHRELAAPSGWALHQRLEEQRLVVYARAMPSVGTTAYKGVLELGPEVDLARLWAAINRIDGHFAVGQSLAESKVYARQGRSSQLYQVMRPPPLLPSSQRYWVLHAVEERDLAGVAGHHRRCWSILPPGEAAEVRAAIQQRHPDAMEVAMSHGCWELRPGSPATLTYTAVSDPGGSVPASVARALSARTLPDNMLSFVRAAR
ncbi:MAG: hypothetical protein JNM72_20920 [Deltaproteobacteria bacterium]|nr:hypothetical protein [Deltaproteobacteria bacterium]